MNTRHFLESYEGPLKTEMGGAFPGERTIFRGQDLHTDLADLDSTELFVFGITGQRFPMETIKILNAIQVSTSYPDARLWNNRVVALAGSTRSTGALGIAGGVAASEAIVFGHQSVFAAMDFICRAMQAINDGIALPDIVRKELQQHKYIRGYGRPVATSEIDERITFMTSLMKNLNVPTGKHLQLAFSIEQTLFEMGRPLRLNAAVVCPCIILDFGFSLVQAYMFLVPVFTLGMYPVFLEALERPSGATFPLRCSKIKYDGPDAQAWI